MKQKVLILTDHENHSVENSLYEFASKMLAHKQTLKIDIASRAIAKNKRFFNGIKKAPLYATNINSSFAFIKEDHPLSKDYKIVNIKEYHLIWLRLPPPLSKEILDFFSIKFKNAIVINNPKSIYKTGSKAFLVNFPSVCPEMKVCNSLEEIRDFKDLFTIVLKPFNEYGGRGIIKIDKNIVISNGKSISFNEFAKSYENSPISYLAVKYLKNVNQGDKRIIVVNGEILGAALRLPAENSWLCNVAMGGSSIIADIEEEEEKIISLINPILSKAGIVMYGIDTLVNDKGQRVLSEINTTSIGGLPQIAKLLNKPLVEKAINQIWNYYNTKTKENG